MEKISGEKKEEENEEVMCLEETYEPTEKCDDLTTYNEPEEKKGLLDRIKEKLPSGKEHGEDVIAPEYGEKVYVCEEDKKEEEKKHESLLHKLQRTNSSVSYNIIILHGLSS